MAATALKCEELHERLGPVFETVEDAIREGRRRFVRGQRAAEDAAAEATRHIRRHPLAAIAAAAAAGVIAGAAFGLAFGWAARGRRT